eukprot:TRINITY_DN26353_c0_g1_i1.p1 TRINITY_DN26353_c0_g1~~TRINITY_DN26353_c0_g1_i1.p1  ORF type:complete len:569 (+),score=148.11 TRINITY_DN26353_c0_g1_i1:282-1988(+)
MPNNNTSSSSSKRQSSRCAGMVIAGKYKLGRKLGSGSFGEIYHGTHMQTGETVAVKLEKAKTKHPQLHYETKLYRLIQGIGIPRVHCSGTEGEHNIMVMDLLGASLEDLFNLCSRKFSLKTVLAIADQMLVRIELLHSKSFVHRDIKPDNFLMGRGSKRNLVYMIDFGLAKMYRDLKTHKHIPYKGNKLLTGTARYASVNTHLGIEQGRRDDIESLGYVLLYFLRGSLPWQGLHATNKKHKYDLISEKKMSTPVEVLCQGFPQEFVLYLNYARSLRFDDEPDYMYLRKLFQDLFKRRGYSFDMQYDWTGVKGAEGKAPSSDKQPKLHDPAPPEADQERRRQQTEALRQNMPNMPSNTRRDPSPRQLRSSRQNLGSQSRGLSNSTAQRVRNQSQIQHSTHDTARQAQQQHPTMNGKSSRQHKGAQQHGVHKILQRSQQSNGNNNGRREKPGQLHSRGAAQFASHRQLVGETSTSRGSQAEARNNLNSNGSGHMDISGARLTNLVPVGLPRGASSKEHAKYRTRDGQLRTGPCVGETGLEARRSRGQGQRGLDSSRRSRGVNPVRGKAVP